MSNRLFALTDKEFTLNQTKKGYTLCNTIKGISFGVFYSSNCPHCKTALAIVKNLSLKANICNFFIINVDTYRNIVDMSQKTISPITYVPEMILYVNGRPFLKYTGQKTENDIGNFIASVIKQLQANKGFTNNSVIDTEAPIETVGGVIPFNIICEGDLCYLTTKEAYSGKVSSDKNTTYAQINQQASLKPPPPVRNHNPNTNYNAYSGM
jgi:thiol-disulfide isomerase/thioredoxin